MKEFCKSIKNYKVIAMVRVAPFFLNHGVVTEVQEHGNKGDKLILRESSLNKNSQQ